MSTIVKIDSRICVQKTEGGFNIDRQDISIVDAIEVLERLTLFMRMRAMGLVTAGSSPAIDSLNINPEEPTDTPKVCIAFDYVTRKIQASVIGMDAWEGCTLLDTAKSYFSALQLGMISE